MDFKPNSPPVSAALRNGWHETSGSHETSDHTIQEPKPRLSSTTASMIELLAENALPSIERSESPSETLSPRLSAAPSSINTQKGKSSVSVTLQPGGFDTDNCEEVKDAAQRIEDIPAAFDNSLTFEKDTATLDRPVNSSRPSIFGPASKDYSPYSPNRSTNDIASSEAAGASHPRFEYIDEDDIMEISPEDASSEIQDKWRQFEFSEGRDEDFPIPVKEERTNLPLNPHIILTKTNEEYLTDMRIIMPVRNGSSSKSSVNGGDPRGHDIDGDFSRRTPNREEDAWMNENLEDNGEFAQLFSIREKLLQKRTIGNITSFPNEKLFEVETKLRKLRRETNLLDMLAADEEDKSLFVPETDCNKSQIVAQHRLQHDDESLLRLMETELAGEKSNITNKKNLTKSGKPRKNRSKLLSSGSTGQAGNKAVKRQRKVQKTRGRELASKAAKKTAPTKSQKNRDNGTESVQSPSSTRSRTVSFWGDHDEIGERILDDLMSNDPISERLCNLSHEDSVGPETGEQQSINTQLKKLYANIVKSNEVQDTPGDKARLKAASIMFGRGKVHAQAGKWLLKGMQSLLFHHQLLGAEWMLKRELSENAPHGGFVADAMGLGKTVQTLACMVANPPMAADIKRNVKATLIVCPESIGLQWVEQIERHAAKSAISRVILYRSSMGLSRDVVQDMDVVVTSYGEVMKQLPFPTADEREEIKASGAQGYKKWWESAKDRVGPLHQISWYRVVLDEAHAIKNNSSRTSLACQNLNSVYRWCLSGTPLMNRLEELFPYFRFLKAHHCMTQATFNKYFCDPNAESSYSRIQTLFSYAMIRRTMKTSILGRPIITLPTPHPFIRYISFSRAEKIIYRITEQRFRSNINKYLKKGIAGRNYSFFMVQLLRLRQCTSHFFLIENTIKEAWTTEDVQELERRLLSIGSAEYVPPFYQQIGVWVREAEAARTEGVRYEAQPFGRSTFGYEFDIRLALKTRKDENLREGAICGICSDVLNEAESTDCGHVFCKGCIRDDMTHQLNNSEVATCPTCNTIFRNLKRHPELDYDYDASSIETEDDGGIRQRKYNTTGADMRGYEPLTKDSTWVAMSDTEPGFTLAPSAKTAALKALLLKIFEEAPMDKVVIYVQFRTLARIVGRICQEEGWGFLYFDGCMSRDSRTKATNIFRTDDDAKILISGIKCGGLGLNLECANRCISLDLWWNHAVEQQAFGRIFRLGQQKETHMGRIVIKGSVDIRMLALQAHKLAICERALQDGEVKKKPKLSFKELAMLFGFLKTDQDDNLLSVEPDYDDQQEWDAGGAGRMDYDGL